MFDKTDKLVVTMLATITLILICYVIFCPCYGLSSEAYKTGEYSGYSLHNESVYNASVLYVNTRVDDSLWFGEQNDIYCQALGYVNGYERWVCETERSDMLELLETE